VELVGQEKLREGAVVAPCREKEAGFRLLP